MAFICNKSLEEPSLELLMRSLKLALSLPIMMPFIFLRFANDFSVDPDYQLGLL